MKRGIGVMYRFIFNQKILFKYCIHLHDYKELLVCELSKNRRHLIKLDDQNYKVRIQIGVVVIYFK